MRIPINQQNFIYNYWKSRDNSIQIFLFGSRADDSKLGGDIDILLVTENKLNHFELFKMKQSFFLAFRTQKLDIINVTNEDNSAFKNYVLSYAQPLYSISVDLNNQN